LGCIRRNKEAADKYVDIAGGSIQFTVLPNRKANPKAGHRLPEAKIRTLQRVNLKWSAPFGRETPPVVFAEDSMTPVPSGDSMWVETGNPSDTPSRQRRNVLSEIYIPSLTGREQGAWYLFSANMLSLRNILCDHLEYTSLPVETFCIEHAAKMGYMIQKTNREKLFPAVSIHFRCVVFYFVVSLSHRKSI
jgi:hypothetical protein